MNDAEAARRGARAKSELSETNAAFDTLRASALERIVASKAGEQALREHLYRTVQVIDTVRKHLTDLVQGGELAVVMEELTQQSG